jgi:hypothetical protein
MPLMAPIPAEVQTALRFWADGINLPYERLLEVIEGLGTSGGYENSHGLPLGNVLFDLAPTPSNPPDPSDCTPYATLREWFGIAFPEFGIQQEYADRLVDFMEANPVDNEGEGGVDRDIGEAVSLRARAFMPDSIGEYVGVAIGWVNNASQRGYTIDYVYNNGEEQGIVNSMGDYDSSYLPVYSTVIPLTVSGGSIVPTGASPISGGDDHEAATLKLGLALKFLEERRLTPGWVHLVDPSVVSWTDPSGQVWPIDGTFHSGDIITFDPPPGTVVPSAWEVDIYMVGAPIPDFRGTDMLYWEGDVTSAGFSPETLHTTFMDSVRWSPGAVTTQFPPAGSLGMYGDAITVVINND